MTARQRRLLIGVGSVAACVLFLWNLGLSRSQGLADPLASTPDPELPYEVPSERPAPPAPSGAVTMAPATQDRQVDAGTVGARREYALGLHELAGLPPDAAPGTAFELWVTWDPPISDAPDLRRLIRDVYVSEVISPLTPDGPTSVIVSVPRSRIGDLMYADRYGALSVSLRER